MFLHFPETRSRWKIRFFLDDDTWKMIWIMKCTLFTIGTWIILYIFKIGLILIYSISIPIRYSLKYLYLLHKCKTCSLNLIIFTPYFHSWKCVVTLWLTKNLLDDKFHFSFLTKIKTFRNVQVNIFSRIWRGGDFKTESPDLRLRRTKIIFLF